MRWLTSYVSAAVAAVIQQYSWGLLEAYGYDPYAKPSAADDDGFDRRTPGEREADIAMLSIHGHF